MRTRARKGLAPKPFGTFCSVFLALFFIACQRSGADSPDASRKSANPDPSLVETDSIPSNNWAATESDRPKGATDSNKLRFIAYNVENWLTMERMIDRRMVANQPKPDSEKSAVLRILVRNQPDVIGLCEIGTKADLTEIQQSLKAAGLDLPHSYHTGGSDTARFLGFLSKFPITSTAKPTQTQYTMEGRRFSMNRGILDASIQAHGKNYRFVGVHLKSKRAVEGGDQEKMRLQEAHLLRRHIDSILSSNADAKLVVYGDFNDTYMSNTLKAVTNSPSKNLRITPVYLKDSQDEAWTHHWSDQDVYSRIDFVMTSTALRREVDFEASHIIDDRLWSKASDHRPLLVVFR
jgi:endonuclease/exonuclease/phosphatase family metal-dependent hydrolase